MVDAGSLPRFSKIFVKRGNGERGTVVQEIKKRFARELLVIIGGLKVPKEEGGS